MFEISLVMAGLMTLTVLIPFCLRFDVIRWLTAMAWMMWWGWFIVVTDRIWFVPAVGWLYFLLLSALVVGRQAKLKVRWFLSTCAACVLMAYGIAMIEFLPAYREHQELLTKHPAVDLTPRLAYEQPAFIEFPTASGMTSVSIGLNDSPRYDAIALQDQQDMFRGYLELTNMRLERQTTNRRMAFQALMNVHEGFVADFISQPGVGRSRITGSKLLRKDNFVDEWEGIRLDTPPKLIEQPGAQAKSSFSAEGTYVEKDPPEVQPLERSLPARDLGYMLSVHFHNVANFVPLNSLGGVDGKLRSRGFDAHAFHLSPEDSERRSHEWRLARLELVSLLKHHPASVYVSDHLPAMDELRDAPTRPLSPFEADAIGKLVKGEDLVTEFSPEGDLTMVGSIRAISHCRDCHQVPTGALLGALSYKLQRR